MAFIFSDFFVFAAALLLKRNGVFIIIIFSECYVYQHFPKTLRNCRHTGPTGIPGLRSFVLRFNVPVNNFLAASNKLSPFDYGSPAILRNVFHVD